VLGVADGDLFLALAGDLDLKFDNLTRVGHCLFNSRSERVRAGERWDDDVVRRPSGSG
jgi:hypothetical protein